MDNNRSNDTREMIKLYYRNEFGSEYEISEVRHMQPDFGDSTIMAFAKTVNLFLRHIGYPSYSKEYVFLESVTADEYDLLQDYLFAIRDGEGENNE